MDQQSSSFIVNTVTICVSRIAELAHNYVRFSPNGTKLGTFYTSDFRTFWVKNSQIFPPFFGTIWPNLCPHLRSVWCVVLPWFVEPSRHLVICVTATHHGALCRAWSAVCTHRFYHIPRRSESASNSATFSPNGTNLRLLKIRLMFSFILQSPKLIPFSSNPVEMRHPWSHRLWVTESVIVVADQSVRL